MTSVATAVQHGERVHPRSAGFWTDLRTVSLRALRLTWRDPEAFGPALAIPLFFFVVNVGALQTFVEGSFPPGFDYKARTRWSPTSRTATSTGCCSRRCAAARCCWG